MAEHFRDRPLASITADDVESMRHLGETLFVELKTGGDDPDSNNYRLAQAVAAFANTLGGWLLLGLDADGQHVTPTPAWIADAGPRLVDAIRDRIRGRLDPLPAFEARTITLPGGPVGVVRVYESADTPVVHVDSGAICVREPAGVRDAQRTGKPGATAASRRRFAVGQDRSQFEVAELVRKGERAREHAQQLLRPNTVRSITHDLGLRFSYGPSGVPADPVPEIASSIFVQLVPLSPPPRFVTWSVSRETVDTGTARLAELADCSVSSVESEPRANGLVLRARLGENAIVRGADNDPFGGLAMMIADGAGLVAVRLSYPAAEGRERARYTVECLAKRLQEILTPLCQWLEDGEILGRCLTQTWFVRLSDTIKLERNGIFQRRATASVPASDEITLPRAEDEVNAVAMRAASTYARACGLDAWG